MPRIRTVRPEFWSSPQVARLHFQDRLFFISLWNFADDYGRGRALPKELAGFAFPHDSTIGGPEVEKMLASLDEVGLISLYEVGGRPYFEIPSWENHQKIDKRSKPRIPSSAESRGSLGGESGESQRDSRVGSRKLEIGNRKEPSSAKPTDDDFEKFWETYPKQQNGKKPEKQKARHQWQMLSPVERERALSAVQHYRADCDKGTFAKYAFRWLRDKTFEDWLTPANPQDREPTPPYLANGLGKA